MTFDPGPRGAVKTDVLAALLRERFIQERIRRNAAQGRSGSRGTRTSFRSASSMAPR